MKKKILIILAVIACIIVALVGYSAYEVHQSAQEFQKTYESKKSFERTETNEAEADGEKKAEEQSGDRPYGVLEPGGEYEVDTYIDNRDNSNRLYHNRGITALTKLVRRPPFAVFVPRVRSNG